MAGEGVAQVESSMCRHVWTRITPHRGICVCEIQWNNTSWNSRWDFRFSRWRIWRQPSGI